MVRILVDGNAWFEDDIGIGGLRGGSFAIGYIYEKMVNTGDGCRNNKGLVQSLLYHAEFSHVFLG